MEIMIAEQVETAAAEYEAAICELYRAEAAERATQRKADIAAFQRWQWTVGKARLAQKRAA